MPRKIRMRCQRRYMRPVGDIETEISERMKREAAMAPSNDTEKKAHEAKAEPQKEGQARQDGGNRGRRSQEQPKRNTSSASSGEISKMNWKETVGTL